MNEAIQIISNNMIELAFLIISGIITGVILPKISGYIQTKTSNEEIKSVMDELERTACSAVDFIEQTVVRQLKADGGWNTESQKEAFKQAVQSMLEGLSSRTTCLVESYGVDISKLATRYIEAAISNKKE